MGSLGWSQSTTSLVLVDEGARLSELLWFGQVALGWLVVTNSDDRYGATVAEAEGRDGRERATERKSNSKSKSKSSGSSSSSCNHRHHSHYEYNRN